MSRETWQEARDRIAGFFDGLVDRYGYDMRGIDYGGRATQQIRFSVIADLMRPPRIARPQKPSWPELTRPSSAIPDRTESLSAQGVMAGDDPAISRPPEIAGSSPAMTSKEGSEEIGLPINSLRVLDVGCGFADFADYLEKLSPPPRHPRESGGSAEASALDSCFRGNDALLAARGIEYVGVDIAPAMIAAARRRRPDLDLHRLDILAEDPPGPFDIVVANGTFYLLGDEAEATMQRLVARMFALARGAVIFTSLSRWAPRQEPGEFYADPLRTLEFCRGLTPCVALRHDYLPHDFAVALYRTPPR
ncbi:MAG TPA: methyltransferase [Stellaceae bacterium]|nr:methyltransferase [Stellaceae bacterium]